MDGARGKATATDTHTPTWGTCQRGDTRAIHGETGSPPSRAKAYNIGELLGTDAITQNHMTPTAAQASAVPTSSP